MEVKSNKVGDIRSHYRLKLSKYYDEREADQLLFFVMEEFSGLSRSRILSEPSLTISESELLKIHFAVKDLMNYKPVQYILGKVEFFGISVSVNPDVLIPRPETEELVDLVIKKGRCKKNPGILDVGTGSGCIAIALAKNLPGAMVTAVDISPAAIQTAQKNAKQCSVKINFIHHNFLDPASWQKHGSYDLIVSNPPYVRQSEKALMKNNVLSYEPAVALFVKDDDPLIFYRAIADFASQYLSPSGSVFCEINQYLSVETERVFRDFGFTECRIQNDLPGNPRFIIVNREQGI
jgi:release factor glutamine methyltransferase